MRNKVCASILPILVYVAQTWWPDSLAKDEKRKNIKNRDGKNCGKLGKFQNCELETIFLVDKTKLVEILQKKVTTSFLYSIFDYLHELAAI